MDRAVAMVMPGRVARERKDRAARIRALPSYGGPGEALPDPDVSHVAYRLALRARMRTALALLVTAEAWIANRKVHRLKVAGGDAWRAHRDERDDLEMAHWKSQRDKAHHRAQTYALALIAERVEDLP